MKIYRRILNIKEDIKKKSLFLFGPRQTGKTFLLKEIFPNSPFYNLLLADVFLKVSLRPEIIREELLAHVKKIPQPIIIDEIQKIPILLDEVHHLIEEYGFRFILTGSSPRKLRRGDRNLLGGRAWTKHLFPLVSKEIDHFDLIRILNYGSIPSIYNSEDPEQNLMAYVGTYLKEEIQAEGLTRKINNFSRFLETAAISNSELINFTSIASDAQVPARTIIEYFKILEDTLTGYLLEPYTKTKKRKAILTTKFYFFDVGVCNVLAGRKNIQPHTELFGKVLEHFIFTELKAYLSYNKDNRGLSFWRSKSGFEVDFLIGDEIAIEVKSSKLVTEKHLAGLNALSEDIKLKRKIVVSMDTNPRRIGDILILPVKYFLEKLWTNDF
jgi:predicted AAA+ superfamily ATPase